ncbi:zinc finger protein 236 isoform X2 [Drosophila takahashii]|uniref:zinc finger protein 236 isoform X2 n=1 Tax=Drosophila takahashii TaxID=29030 RepID=UPI0038996747
MALNKRNSTHSDAISGAEVVDYKFSCRCCLKTDVEYLKLDSVAVARSLDPADAGDKIPLLRCLLFCVSAENAPELPQYICIECSKSLQVAYYFLKNALRAHEILCRKLCPKRSARRLNGSLVQEPPKQERDEDPQRTKPLKPMRHECQVCGVVVYNRLELKQHIRQHAEGLSYNCKFCNFTTLKQRILLEHYVAVHDLSTGQAEEHLKSKDLPAHEEEETKAVCTLEDMELLIPTVLTPEDYAQPQPHIDSDQLRDIERQLAVSMGETAPAVDTLTSTLPPMDTPNVSIGTEYLVMPDGSLQQVNGSGVVIEYIDDSKPNNPSNVNIGLHNLLAANEQGEPMDIDVSELIVEETMPQIRVKPKPTAGGSPNYKHKCKVCPKTFATVARLKSHQLTHSNLPKFFCDQCDFYSLRSADLIQHYKMVHRSDENGRSDKEPAQAEESRVFSCDMCLFETRTASQLRTHYTEGHTIQPTEVQLRPSWTAEEGASFPQKPASIGVSPRKLTPAKKSNHTDIPVGIKYPPVVVEAQVPVHQPAPMATTSTTITETGDINVVVDATPLFYAATSTVATNPVPVTTAVEPSTGEADSNAFGIFPEIPESNLPVNEAVPQVAANTSNISIFGDMQDFIDNTDVAAICTIPADDMPVVDGDDIVIDNNNISLDFDAENLFEDFEEEEDAVGEEEEEEEDEADNDDENDNNDAATDQNLLLTSDDDDVDDFDDEQSKHLQKPYCIYCNKKFTSQYKFENHMFVHRGLAPYRCELCTNLYNMKRLLIRHYKTVHKRMPTRDMVQAKGDKVSVARTNIEKIYLGKVKKPMLMCAKCPFECDSDADMRKHLNAHHGINDGVSVHANEVFIIRKLPFECPRCIRSFAAKSTLSRHLQRSHLVDTIIEMQTPQSAESTTVTLGTSSSTGPGPENPVLEANKHNEMMQTDGGAERMTTAASGNGGGNAAGKDDGSGKSGKMDAAVPEEELDPVTLDAATAVTTTAIAAAITAAAAAATAATSSESPITTTASSTNSTLFPTPTPFDYEYDFMGDAAQRSTPNPHAIPKAPSTDAPPSSLLNGSDKLLTTAALAASPVKGLRSNSRLLRTSTYMCKLCNKTFDELGKLVKHEMDQHSNTEPSRWGYQHKCAICNTTYRTLTLLKFHMKRHGGRKSQCKLCPKTFVTTTELERHTKSKHGKEKTLRCTLDGCRKTFAFKHHLVRHQNATHLNTRHICPVCKEEMQSSLHLRNHMSVHKGPLTYKCPKCDRSYLRRGRLQSHALLIHKIRLTTEDLADISSQSGGLTNPHDLKESYCNKDVDGEMEIKDEPAAAADNSK